MKNFAALDAAVDAALADKRIVGTVTLVARDRQIVYRRAAGLADREQRLPMREDAVFRLASITKPIVTAAVMRMIELGHMRLDDPITRWLPNFRPALADGAKPTITVRRLLTHTSGLTYGFLEPEGGPYHSNRVSDGLDQPGLAMDEQLRRLSAAGLLFAPGERWNYSLALDVLGAALEQIEGARLEAIVRRHIVEPLGLADLSFELTPAQRERLVTPYADGTPEPIRMNDSGHHVAFPPVGPYAGLAGVFFMASRVDDPSSFQSGGGGMNGTASDVLTVVDAIRAGGHPVLSRESAAAMMSNQTGDFAIPNRGPGWGFGYGGAVLYDPNAANTPQTAGTWGWGGVWGHHWFVDPAKRLTVVILTNTALEGMMGRFPRDVRDAIYRDQA